MTMIEFFKGLAHHLRTDLTNAANLRGDVHNAASHVEAFVRELEAGAAKVAPVAETVAAIVAPKLEPAIATAAAEVAKVGGTVAQVAATVDTLSK
jgi:ABC-type transporter Mla subunit MlaD